MLFQESSVIEETLKNMQDTTDESDETLSLCDLPLYNDHQNLKEWQGDLSSFQQDYFEFSSQELGPSTTGFPPESVIFCGKLIPYKKEEEDSSQLIESKKETNVTGKRDWGMMRWIFCLRGNNRKSTTLQSAKKQYNSNKHENGYDYPVPKMSLLTSSISGKASRWYSFGISRISSEVQLKDIKRRLSSRNHCPSSPVKLSSSSGLTGLIRVLSCGGNHPNTMVVSSTSFSRKE